MSIFIDISHIAKWNERMSGIERVEFNIIKHFQKKDDVIFVGWSDEDLQFKKIEKQVIQTMILQIEQRQDKSEITKELSMQKYRIFSKLIKRRVKSSSISGVFNATNKEDVLFVLDGLWDNKNYINEIVRIAKNTTIYHIVYDMIPIVTPGYVVDFMPPIFEGYMKKVLPLCNRIFAISENSAKDTKEVLKSWFPNRKLANVESFLLGDDIAENLMDNKVTPKMGIPEEFILSVGTVEVRKNYDLLFYVYGLARERNLDLPPTCIVGKRGWLSGDLQYKIEHDRYFSSRIIILENVTDSQLEQLYKKALYVIYPSYYEGWGLPVRESLAHGKVTLSSNTSSLIQAGGSTADYFSPFNSEELLGLMNKYLDSSARNGREREIKNVFKTLSWSDAMEQFESLVLSK